MTPRTIGLIASLAIALPLAANAHPILDSYRAAARQENPAFKDFSADAGRTLYTTVGSNQLACTSCHTDSPKNSGRHAKTNKPIAPMAPSVNPKRFTDQAQVDKWFKRNCHDVLGHDCSAQDKGNFVAYMLSVQ